MGLGITNLTKILQLFKENGVNDKSLCMIGKQDIHIGWEQLMEIIHNYNFYYNKKIYEEIKNKQPIDSYKLFEMFGISGEVHAVDFSGYENADIIFDLNNDLPESMREKYDYVINGGTLEHVFDVAKAMHNISDMVKSGGMAVHVVPFGGMANHGFYSFSPTFFQDYCASNGFEISNLSIEFVLENDDIIFSQDCRIFDGGDCEINRYVKKVEQIHEIECMLLICVAKKCTSKSCCYPTQGMYKKIDSACGKKICYQDIFKLFKTDKRIVLYGTGHISDLLINELYKADMEEAVDCVMDSETLKAGTYHRGYKVVYPTISKLDNADIIFICTTKYEEEIYSSLIHKGIGKERLYRITDYMK